MGVGTLYIVRLIVDMGGCKPYCFHYQRETFPVALEGKSVKRTKEGGAEEVDCISILQPQLGRRKKGRLYLHRGKTVENKPSVEKKNQGSSQRVTVKLFPQWLLFPCQLSFRGAFLESFFGKA